MSVTVLHLDSDEVRVYSGITPRQAVIAAYAQSRGDWNTWDYDKRYGKQVTEGRRSVACGSWAAVKDAA